MQTCYLCGNPSRMHSWVGNDGRLAPASLAGAHTRVHGQGPQSTPSIQLRNPQVHKLVGRGAPAEFVEELKQLAEGHHENLSIDCIRWVQTWAWVCFCIGCGGLQRLRACETARFGDTLFECVGAGLARIPLNASTTTLECEH